MAVLVLILVVVDDGLVPIEGLEGERVVNVLILVVVDDGLVLFDKVNVELKKLGS